jgi:hypothetical protein
MAADLLCYLLAEPGFDGKERLADRVEARAQILR